MCQYSKLALHYIRCANITIRREEKRREEKDAMLENYIFSLSNYS